MSIIQTTNRLTKPRPPPSPVPTGKGSRSASNEPFTRFLEDSLQVPHLKLPSSQLSEITTTRHQIPAKVDLRSLVSTASDSIHRLLESAEEFGAFRISCHGISVYELRSLVEEAEWGFEEWEKECKNIPGSFFERDGNRREIVWVRSRGKTTESESQVIGDQRYRIFSENMESIATKIEEIAEQLCLVFSKNTKKKDQKTIFEGNRYTLSLHRYNHHVSKEQNPSRDITKSDEFRDHLISLHLPFEHCRFHLQSEQNACYFDAGPETVVVTVGKQLEEWSLQEFKSVSGKMIFVPDYLCGNRASFSMELKLSSSSIDNVMDRNCEKMISIRDQIILAIILSLIYKIFMFLTS